MSNYFGLIGFILGVITGYLLWPGGRLRKGRRPRLRPGRRRAAPGQRPNPEFKVTLDKPPAGLFDFTKDQSFEITFSFSLSPPGHDINTDDFEIPEYLEEREENK